jgi:uncharacterized membrane protein
MLFTNQYYYDIMDLKIKEEDNKMNVKQISIFIFGIIAIISLYFYMNYQVNNLNAEKMEQDTIILNTYKIDTAIAFLNQQWQSDVSLRQGSNDITYDGKIDEEKNNSYKIMGVIGVLILILIFITRDKKIEINNTEIKKNESTNHDEDIKNKIRKLQIAKDEGILNEEEYNRKVSELINN